MRYKLIDNTYVMESPIHGWGVFANKRLWKNDVIIECVMPFECLEDKDRKSMINYRFSTPEGKDTIPLGNAAVINCGKGDKANCEWQINEENRIYRGIASKDIIKDSEILWDYFIDYSITDPNNYPPMHGWNESSIDNDWK